MNHKDIGKFCDILADQMDIKPDSKHQRDNFKKQMRKYEGKKDFVALNELFKLCVKLHLELEKRPANIEPEGDSISEKLDYYSNVIKGFPDRYTKLSQMREFDDISTQIEEYLDIVEDDENYEEKVEYIKCDFFEARDEIVEKFGVKVFKPSSLCKEKQTMTWIYSPQSYTEYMKTIENLIKDNPHSRRLTQYKQEILEKNAIKQILQENQN